MTSVTTQAKESAPPPKGVVLLPAARFFVRRIPLVSGADAVAQVELALETIGPFTPGQLYYGFCPSRDGTQALVFAAYRKNLATAATAAFAEAQVVLPEFAICLGQTSPVPAGVWFHEQAATITAIVWDGTSELPVGLLAREAPADSREAARNELLREINSRFGSISGSTQTLHGPVVATTLGKEGLGLALGNQTAVLAPEKLRVMDVRDKAELSSQHGRQKRDRVLWLAFASLVVGLAACVTVEAGVQVTGWMLARQRRSQAGQADAVRQIEQTNQLTVRMEDLANQSMRPFEMLAVLNSARPASVEFIRATTGGPRVMEIEAQSGNASDPQDYEKALRRATGIEQVELRDLRTSGGRTSFLVAVTFKPGFAGQGGGP